MELVILPSIYFTQDLGRAVASQTCISEAPGTNLGSVTGHTNRGSL